MVACTAQVHRATISSAEGRLRALRLSLDVWKEEVVAARRSRAWIGRWEAREPEREDLLLDDGSGRVDEVLAASLLTVASSSASSLESSAGAGAGRYTAGSEVSPGAYAQEQMVRYERFSRSEDTLDVPGPPFLGPNCTPFTRFDL
ncbi:hypothetical protein V8E36_002910 [Tilletia maclaganii]